MKQLFRVGLDLALQLVGQLGHVILVLESLSFYKASS